MSSHRLFLTTAALLPLWAAVGCGDRPALASVEGTVRLDGSPLENARVVFTPIGPGRPSSGRTDADGTYSLVYTSDRSGALPGEHAVSITTHVQGDVDSGSVGAPERVPVQYNVNSELKKTVKADDNVIDFDLESKGKIVQPKGE